MAPIYADHPFSLLQTPVFLAKSKDVNAQVRTANKCTTPVVHRRLQTAHIQTDIFDMMASEMVNVHNMLIRGLNSIYLQAPYIKPADDKSFCKYVLGWYVLLHSHHGGEEATFFPTVERMTGIKGLMDTNVEQHRVFHDGVDELKSYAEAVIASKEKYDGNKIVELVDSFGTALTQHLADEIPTIQSLRQYGEKLAGLPKEFEKEAETAMVLSPSSSNCVLHHVLIRDTERNRPGRHGLGLCQPGRAL
jgi:hypothetical protein